MFQEERMQLIIEHLRKHNRISAEEIVTLFDVSRDTARRDLIKLEEQEAIIRTRGGAILPSPPQEFRSYQERLKYVSEEKRAIGKLAAALVRSGETIILDSSTTVQACAENLNGKSCTVITNSLHSAELLSNHTAVQIRLLGGKLDKEQRYVYGTPVIETLSHYYVDKVFIGIGGLTLDGFSASEEEGKIKHQMMKSAKKVIVLADHSKMGRRYGYRFADWTLVDVFITDQMPNQEWIDFLTEQQVDLLIPEPTQEKEL
ncbi:DeoR/GlpR family DNA-binding transcription regulator [Paenibacillus silvae]|uniref:DeoR/GlpR transcriptional regulator n=1 Tax=Paenibacillus silvae TaxID=1325358 RepID=A0A2W6NK18_9BACL|nr:MULTISPECIES: DeoR/GlpR family DNA-binding transcription regulator [Paenibacillus]MCK6074825.1 DeoR/GlpR family DNA-binding transcription regulator [Paenibacillus silvae]MCK6147700.1 DeoR/GlpR family DNA-binding transcription regulator [Paenibacillus silvae]MCK6265998.1 DeoR/GlpR family DNA-binding transcription regulator [Paenibacillus silvae]PZT55418.1 DeoR/GlpR transcriptional regulator [Paenibacillus silvae]GGH56085.1 HTH-type transcriptional repressor GlcR [Paenibacillus silvae]